LQGLQAIFNHGVTNRYFATILVDDGAEIIVLFSIPLEFCAGVLAHRVLHSVLAGMAL